MKLTTLRQMIHCWAAGAAIVLPLLGAARASLGAISDCIDATCRITASDGGRGSGCVFEISQGRVYVLTAAHVVEKTATVLCEFWTQGHQSAPLPARVLMRSEAADAAVIALEAGQFAGRLPKVVPFAARDWMAAPGETLLSVGCANGAWSTGWKGHVIRHQGGDLHFVPTPANGRSGSALFDAEGTKIVGIVRARDERNDNGIATSVQSIYQGLQAAQGGSSLSKVSCGTDGQLGQHPTATTPQPQRVRCPLCQVVYDRSRCPLQAARPHCPKCTALCEELVQCGPGGCGPGGGCPTPGIMGGALSGSASGIPQRPNYLLPYRNYQAQRDHAQNAPSRPDAPAPNGPWPTLPSAAASLPASSPVDLGPVLQRLDAIADGQVRILEQIRQGAPAAAEGKARDAERPTELPIDEGARQGVASALQAIEVVAKDAAEAKKTGNEAAATANAAKETATKAQAASGDVAQKHDRLEELVRQHGSLFERFELRKELVDAKLGADASTVDKVREYAKSYIEDKIAGGGMLDLAKWLGLPVIVLIGVWLITRDFQQKAATGDPLMIEKALAAFGHGQLLQTLHGKVTELAGKVETAVHGAPPAAAAAPPAASATKLQTPPAP